MITITVNCDDGEYHHTVWKGSVEQTIEAAKLLYPGWTSMLLTLTNIRKTDKD